jgi:PAS domain S-box-containing protein
MACAGGLLVSARAQPTPIDAPPPGLIETGVPSFAVIGYEALGMASLPVDMQQLPDGRLLAVGNHEFALGDGSRWEVFRQADGDIRANTQNVAVDSDGRIYAGIPGGFARVEFEPEGRWRFVRVANLPPVRGAETATPLYASTAGDNWFWWWGGGQVVAWHPGSPARIAGFLTNPLRALVIGGKIHLSDDSTGSLARWENDAFHAVALPPGNYVDQAFTCAAPLGDGRTLVGTVLEGVKVVDGTGARPFVTRGPLSGGLRVKDLIVTNGGYFAAALDNFGIVFFDSTGRIVQALDRSVDQRLSRVEQLLSTRGGTIWARLNDGLARVAFPSRVSNFEPFIPTSLFYSQPCRFLGRLWLMSDGRAERGVYDEDNRLTHFEIDSPKPYLTSLVVLDGTLLATTRDGIFRRPPGGGWVSVPDTPNSAFIMQKPVAPGRWLYVAENEVGWLDRANGAFTAERFSVPDMGHPFEAVADKDGNYWVELGPAKVARVEAKAPRPAVITYGVAEGMAQGWSQIFMLGGQVMLNVAEQILRFDAGEGRFVRDDELPRQMPLLCGAIGRPTLDTRGRLWLTNLEKVQVVRPDAARPGLSLETMPEGFMPNHFTPQRDGVMWLIAKFRLARFDPSMPPSTPAPLRALITDVRLNTSGRTLYSVGAELDPIPASDNSMTVHFLAPDNPIGQSVTFEVRLEGAGGRWVSTGASGVADYSHLDDGRYLFHVRPRIGLDAGREATLAFTVLAPWYRTRIAYAAYGLGACAILVLTGWLTSIFERREKARLERVVAARTRELNNAVLARIHGEETLIASETRYRRLFESAKDGILILDADTGTVVDVNPYLVDILGCSHEAFLGRKIWELSFFRELLGSQADFERLQQNEYTRYDDVALERTDGRRIEVEFVSNVYIVNQRKVIQFNIRDITERKLAEQKVLEQAALLDKANDAIYVRTLDRTILYWNQGAERLYGWTREEAVHRKTTALFTQDLESANQNQEDLLKTGSWLGERRQITKSGRIITVLSRLTLVRDTAGKPMTILAINADVTEKKLLEARFLRAQRQESLGALASGIAHDLNNVLTPIMISAQLLQEPVGDEDRRQLLSTIEASAARGAGIVKQVLTFARGVEGERLTLQPRHFVKDISDIAGNTFPKNIRIETRVDGELWPIQGDATQLQQALMNLCVNARDAMPAGGTLTLTAENVVLDEAFVRSTPHARVGPHVRLEVVDTGVGIRHEIMDKIFDPFFTTKAPGKGTGLGLSTVLGIMRSHGGFVRVTSEEGKGTRFELNFPATPAANIAAGHESERVMAKGRGELILVVDDEQAVRDVLRRMLEKYGYKVVAASEGGEATGVFIQHRNAIAAVITDMMMPGMDGPALVQSLRRIDPNVRIIGMSGSGGKEEVNKNAPWSVPVFLSKPFTGEKLLAALKEVFKV